MLLLGTKEEIAEPVAAERPKFVEDMNEAELASAVIIFEFVSWSKQSV